MPWTTPTDRTTGYVVTAADWNIVEDDLSFLYGDAGWTAVASFTNSWGASGTPPGYILLGRVVHLRGAMTAGTANTVAFTLPVGYRPSNAIQVNGSVNAASTINVIAISTGGAVSPVSSAITWLSGICFPVV